MELPEEGGGSFHCLISSSDGCIAKKSVPGELLIELLSYLPIKSVCKFRCVSKSWLKLFTNDPFFAKLHLSHQSNESKLHITSFLAKNYPERGINKFYLAETSDISKLFELPFCLDTPSYYFVHGICNGMVLLSKLDNVYIWNPLTRDYIHIRCCPPESTIPLGHSMCRNFGFGLNQATNEYKVVSYRQSRVILSFDLKEEVLKRYHIHIRPELIFKDVYLELVELGGLLCMFGIQFGVELQIWVMKQYGVNGSWTKQFKIGLLGVCGSLEYLRPVGIANSGEIILIQSSVSSTKKIVLYNAETDSVRDVKIFDSGHWNVFAYTGSLISPKFISGLNHNRT
ncbi:hypothetical protein IFM89_006907 [Coptis chinensis]|uniref:F-box domain-containing protein n=1 Tax=Coptis chinensis TaxID=261450 RepID=A0A835HBG9_9MAGN|nr:hypothetical protein IFM89_006907 [Coptis chinensis]